jgi:hypothetical protein
MDKYWIENPLEHTPECLEYAGDTKKPYCIAQCYDERQGENRVRRVKILTQTIHRSVESRLSDWRKYVLVTLRVENCIICTLTHDVDVMYNQDEVQDTQGYSYVGICINTGERMVVRKLPGQEGSSAEFEFVRG